MRNILIIMLAVGFGICVLQTQNQRTVLADEAFNTKNTMSPALKDKKAIDYLKQTGGLESLSAEVKATRNGRNGRGARNADLSPEAGSFTLRQKPTAGDGSPEDYFGGSVAISGDTAIVGASNDDGTFPDQGAAYVYVRNGRSWTQQAKLTVPDGLQRDYFGVSVAISGDTAVVGAYLAEVAASGGPQLNEGAAYVFVRNGSTWTLQQRLISGDIPALRKFDFFGYSVAIEGDTIAVGATGDTVVTNIIQGSATVFVRNGAMWTQQQKITAADGVDDAEFGCSVALSGNTLLVGAALDGTGISNRPGSAYVFTRDETGWTQQAKLIADDRYPGQGFGESVSLSNDKAMIGARSDHGSGGFFQGAAYAFARTGAIWTQQQKLTAADGDGSDYFGFGVYVSGNIAIIGAPGDEVGSAETERRGSAYVFTLSGAGWAQQQKLIANDGAMGDNFGAAVAINSAGNSVIVGAPFDDLTALDEGSAYMFQNDLNIAQTPFDFDGDAKSDVSVFRRTDGTWYIANSSAGFSAAQFGLSNDKLTPADYDGDGKTDIAVYRDGTWYMLRSQQGFAAVQFGLAGDIPVPADYDGDGRADVSVYRDGTWYLSQSQLGFAAFKFGIATDKPVPADFDGDGKTDAAVYRDGTWYIQRSQQGFTGIQFGISSDVPTVGDYDGDGKADPAVYRSGTWFVLGSTQGFYAAQFGVPSDIPVSADYDGDGKTDIAVYRDGTWYMLRSHQGFNAVQFGIASDKPVPAAFVP